MEYAKMQFTIGVPVKNILLWLDKMVADKIVYVQNGMDRIVAFFGIDYNSTELNIYLVSKSH